VGDEAAAAASATSERVGPPARPGKESTIPSPLLEFIQPRPRVLTLSVATWMLSCLAGLLIIAYFLYRLEAVHALLETTMREEEPAVDEGSLQVAINSTIAVALGLVGLSVALKIWLALVMAARRNWARVLLTIVGVVALPITAVSATLLTVGTVEERIWMLLAIIAQEVLVVVGMITMYLPGPNTWFRLRLRR
jgi:predicted anti-sigma-YlaC factor YlaD